MEITKEQIKKLHKGLESCPEAQDAIGNAFPEVFEGEWKEMPVDTMTLEKRRRASEEIGVLTPLESFYMPYNVEFTDAWKGDRENGNPMTKLFIYKLVNGKIYRRKR